jgi:Zn finger protein HypA/HybF involved in hydrogenase expression
MEDEILICPNCGSENIEMKCWVTINTNFVGEAATFDEADYWCPNCETHQYPINKKEYEEC